MFILVCTAGFAVLCACTKQLKEKYALTDEQIKAMHDSGISYPQLAMVAQLSKSSQKPIEEVFHIKYEK